MAKVTLLPAPKILQAFRGKLDFYCYRGVICVRSWPRKPKMPRSPANQAAAAIFGDFSARLNYTDPDIMKYLASLGTPYAVTWKDQLTSAGYNKLITW